MVKKILLILAGIIVGFILVVGLKFNQFYQKIYIPTSVKPKDKTSYNILFLGYGGAGHDGPYLTDTMLITHVDIKQNKALLVSVPRDIWVKLPTKSGQDFHAKINTLYEMGLFPSDFPDVDQSQFTNPAKTGLVSSTLQKITGLPIDYFVGIDFTGFVKAVDILGGVDINVDRSFKDDQYPLDGHEKDLCGKDDDFKQIELYLNDPNANAEEKAKLFQQKPDLETFLKNATDSPQLAFPCRFETIKFDAGPEHMDGKTALKYVRSRHSSEDGGDFGRARRQQLFLEAVKAKVLNIGFIPRIIPLLDQLKDHIATDIPLDATQRFASEIKDLSKYKVGHLVLSDEKYIEQTRSPEGQDVLIPKAGIDKWDQVKAWIRNTINGKK